jgi:hypothetical protein
LKEALEAKARCECAVAFLARHVVLAPPQELLTTAYALAQTRAGGKRPLSGRLEALVARRALEAVAPAAPLLEGAIEKAKGSGGVGGGGKELEKRARPVLGLIKAVGGGGGGGGVGGSSSSSSLSLGEFGRAVDALGTAAELAALAQYAASSSSSSSPSSSPTPQNRICSSLTCGSHKGVGPKAKAGQEEEASTGPRLRCGACRSSVWLCNSACQKAAFRAHKNLCSLVKDAKEAEAARRVGGGEEAA